MTRRSRCPISICTVKATATNGQCTFLLIVLRRPMTSGRRARIHAVLQHHAAAAHRERPIHMIQDIQRLLDAYHAWLKDKTALRQVDDWIEITTPYLDRHNDYVQIYAKKSNGSYILTDDGYTIDDLETSGCKLQSPKRQ